MPSEDAAKVEVKVITFELKDVMLSYFAGQALAGLLAQDTERERNAKFIDTTCREAFMIAETMMVYANPIDDANKSTK